MNPRCRACQSENTQWLFNMGHQPLSLVAMQHDANASKCLERYAINLHICQMCGHVFNAMFDPKVEQYSGAGCRMFNNGSSWQDHINEEVREIQKMSDLDLIVEVGAGDCEFLSRINTPAVKIAVDPCMAVLRAAELGLHYDRAYFDPERHIPEGAGNTLVIMRHLLEHMNQPRNLLESITKRAQEKDDTTTYIMIEVPCAEIGLQNTRIEDWTYEHPQHFTLRSLGRLMENCGIKVMRLRKKYDGEVLVGYGYFITGARTVEQAKATVKGFRSLSSAITTGGAMLRDMGKDVAFWGAAGKSAMFLRRFRIEPSSLVVDSDPEKVGMCVPGTGIPIYYPEVLETNPVKTIVATTSWRAEDIRNEIKQRNIQCERLLKFEGCRFVEVDLGN